MSFKIVSREVFRVSRGGNMFQEHFKRQQDSAKFVLEHISRLTRNTLLKFLSMSLPDLAAQACMFKQQHKDVAKNGLSRVHKARSVLMLLQIHGQ